MLFFLIMEHIFSILEEGLMDMHTAPIDPEYRFRKECSMQSIFLRYLLDDKHECRYVVCRMDRSIVSEIDLMLSWSNLMMRSLYLESELLER